MISPCSTVFKSLSTRQPAILLLAGSFAALAVRFLVKVWNSTDDGFRRIIWRCNGKYPAKGEKGCESRHVDDVDLYKAFVNVFNMMVENKNYFIDKWKRMRENDNVLARYKAVQFMRIISDTKPIPEFDVDMYFALVEKMTVYDGCRIIVSLLDRTDVECEIE